MKMTFNGTPTRAPEVIAEAIRFARRFPELQRVPLHNRKLAVVGGGPSLAEHVDELFWWDGDIWAINQAYRWCFERGIRANFFSVDPETFDHVEEPTFCVVRRGELALLSNRCPPVAFETLANRGVDVQWFDTLAGPTGATLACRVAPDRGYQDVYLFGCDSSYEYEPGVSLYTHAYRSTETDPKMFKVAVGNEEFITKPELLCQALLIAGYIKIAPKVFKCRSGGILPALVESDGEYDIIEVQESLLPHMVIEELKDQAVDAR